MEPLRWNDIDDIARFLSDRTAREWTPREVLDLALREYASRPVNYVDVTQPHPDYPHRYTLPTLLSVALPIGATVVCYGLVPEIEDVRHEYWTELGEVRRTTAPLFVEQIDELIARGETIVDRVNPRNGPDIDAQGRLLRYDVRPPVIITHAMVGEGPEQLEELVRFSKASAGSVTSPASTTPKSSRLDRMAIEIERAFEELGPNADNAAVMGRLRSYAGRDGSCITHADPGFFLWKDGKGKVQKLTRSALQQRLNDRANKPRR